jgi:hypothetical protein
VELIFVSFQHEPDSPQRSWISSLLLLTRGAEGTYSRAHSTGEAKFWLEPRVELATNYGLTKRRLNAALKIIQDNLDEIKIAWETHFES